MNTVTKTNESAVAQYENLVSVIKSTFEDPRVSKMLSLYEDYKDNMLVAPASSKVSFHNCYPGGYLDHINNVLSFGLDTHKMFKANGYPIDYTKQELVFSILGHDFGKLGDENKVPYYIEQESDWHRKQGALYKKNPKTTAMTPTDGALLIFQKYGIEVTSNEWMAIKLSDGLYDESNKKYLINYQGDKRLSILVRIVHWADHMACEYERGMWENNTEK